MSVRFNEVDYLESLTWHTPPELRHEPLAVSFAADTHGVYQRIEDESGWRYSYATWEDVWCDWCPWRAKPNVNEWRNVGGITVH